MDDRKLGPAEVERIREIWEVRCNRALRKAGFSQGVSRQSLQTRGIKRTATQHLGPRATAMTRNGCRLPKAEANREIFTASRRMAEIEHHLQLLKKDHANRVPKIQPARQKIRGGKKPNLAPASDAHRSSLKRKTYGLAVRGENRALPITEIDLLEIIPGRGLHIRTRQESWLASLPKELQSDELLRAITSEEVNCLSGSCELYESSAESSK